MSIAKMKERIFEKVSLIDDEKALSDVLQVLSKEPREYGIDAMKYKNELFSEHDGLLKRLS